MLEEDSHLWRKEISFGAPKQERKALQDWSQVAMRQPAFWKLSALCCRKCRLQHNITKEVKSQPLASMYVSLVLVFMELMIRRLTNLRTSIQWHRLQKLEGLAWSAGAQRKKAFATPESFRSRAEKRRH